MRGISLRGAAVPMILVSLLTACGGDGGPAVLPEKGAEVCDQLDATERFRYTFNYVLESPQQESPPDDLAGADYAVKPSQPDFLFTLTHTGAFLQPDRMDFEISTTPSEPTVRTIRIGENQYYFLGGNWQAANEPPAFPFTPANVCDAIVSPLDLAGQTGNLESVGDTEARHFRIEAAPLAASSQLLGTASDMGRLLKSYDVDVWLSVKEARLVKVEAVSTAPYPYGRELSVKMVLEISSYNDKDIEIEPPI